MSIALQRRLVRLRGWTPLDSRRSLTLWLAAWGVALVLALALPHLLPSHLWAPVVVYPVVFLTLGPSWLQGRRIRRRLARRGIRMPGMDWVVAMFAILWLAFLAMATLGL